MVSRPGKSLARERALQCLYQIEITGREVEGAAALFWEHFHSEERNSAYFHRLVAGVRGHCEELDAYISRFSQHWRLERMASVDRNILRLAIFELLHCPEVPPKVVVNEAVELGKRFGAENSGAFINGILDSFLKARQPDRGLG
ncbi:transcription antitermination factor NusB [Desulfobacca acetoxidans]|uniref:transcription antitermination factor NusB n=1 Tax=Desulfobacca acetoxidans TaxID=60893 RepID=UPI00059D7B10